MDVKRTSRRSLLMMLVSAVSYLLYRVAAHNSWIIVTRGEKRFDRGARPISLNPSDEISLLVVGDTGLPTPQRVAVVHSIEQQIANRHLDAVVMLGDNFYEKGVQSVSDPRFESDFELLFDSQRFDCPFHVALGNHDYEGSTQAQIQYTEHSTRWRMPSTHYMVRYRAKESTLDLFVIDTNPIDAGAANSGEQLRWLDDALDRSDATWKIVAGHHPCLSGGEHGPSENVRRQLGPLLTKHGVAIYLSGHDHDLQLLDSKEGWFQGVSGSGSKLRSTSWTSETCFAAAVPGFAWLFVQNGQLSISFFDDRRRLYSKQIPGPLSSRPAAIRRDHHEAINTAGNPNNSFSY